MLSEDKVRNFYLSFNPNQESKIEINFVDIGNLNYVYRISHLNKTYYLKQALPKYRKRFPFMEQLPLKGDRLINELKALKILKNVLDRPEFNLPEVLFFDEKYNLAILSEVKGTTIKEHMENNNIVNSHAISAAEFLGFQHSKTLYKDIRVRENDDDFFKNVAYFRSVLSSKNLEKKSQLYIQNKFNIVVDKFPKALINGDYSTKQVFIENGKIGVCDLEFACYGDPAYDAGFFLAHYEIENAVNPGGYDKLKKAVKSFLAAYSSFIDKHLIEERLPFYIGTGILDRIDGTVMDKRLSDPAVKILRKRAVEIVRAEIYHGL